MVAVLTTAVVSVLLTVAVNFTELEVPAARVAVMVKLRVVAV